MLSRWNCANQENDAHKKKTTKKTNLKVRIVVHYSIDKTVRGIKKGNNDYKVVMTGHKDVI